MGTLIAAGMAAALALPALAPGIPATESAEKVDLHAHLSGAEEVPPPGDAEGAGLAEVTLKPKKKKVCFDITHVGLSPDEPFAGHIHEGVAGVAGPIVVTLFATPSPSPVSGCEKNVKKGLLKDIARDPGDFYVNLHTAEFPGGAIRGQLGTD